MWSIMPRPKEVVLEEISRQGNVPMVAPVKPYTLLALSCMRPPSVSWSFRNTLLDLHGMAGVGRLSPEPLWTWVHTRSRSCQTGPCHVLSLPKCQLQAQPHPLCCSTAVPDAPGS